MTINAKGYEKAKNDNFRSTVLTRNNPITGAIFIV